MGNTQKSTHSPMNDHFQQLVKAILEFQQYYSEILFEMSTGNASPYIDAKYLIEFKQFLESKVRLCRETAAKNTTNKLFENDAFLLSNYIDVLSSSFVYKHIAGDRLIYNGDERLYKETTQICDYFKNRKNPLFLSDSYRIEKSTGFLECKIIFYIII